jgi:rod shape-determining protein MreC
MFILRRWWDRKGVAIVLGGLTLSAAWMIRQTQGAALFEAYQLMSRPFQLGLAPEDRLTDARVQELQQRLVELESQTKSLKIFWIMLKPKNNRELLHQLLGVAQTIGGNK